MDEEPRRSFSRRYGYLPIDKEITIREDAPEAFRVLLLDLAIETGRSSSRLRDAVCRVLGRFPTHTSWADNPLEEARELLRGCEWFYVYDVAEAFYQELQDYYPGDFEASINEYFREAGIGWQLVEGVIQTRGPESFESSVRGAMVTLDAAGLSTASREIHEALRDLSRRPEPDLTGAMHHSMAALECVARQACGKPKLDLGDIMKRHPDLLPRPLDQVVSKAWGYASDMGRHVREGRLLSREEVELVVGLAGTVATYLARKTGV